MFVKGRKIHRSMLPIAVMAALMVGNAFPALAAGSSVTIDKTLTMDAASTVPSMTFPMTITAGTSKKGGVVNMADGSSTHRLDVKAGISPELVTITSNNGGGTSAKFDENSRTTLGSIDSNGTITASTSRKFVTDTMTIDFSNVPFTEPGVYRYILTEGTVAGVDNDITNALASSYTLPTSGGERSKRQLDVYVESDDDGNLSIGGIVVYKFIGVAQSGFGPQANGTNDTTDIKDTGHIDANTSTTTDPATGKPADKVDTTGAAPNTAGGFVNQMAVTLNHSINANVKVTGNQASRDQYFAVTYTIKNATPGSTIPVAPGASYDKTPTGNSATEYSASTMSTANNITSLTVGGDGTVTHTFYLKNGQSVKVGSYTSGEAINVTVSVDPKNYVQNGNAPGTSTATQITDVGSAGDYNVDFDLNLNGVVPTGVLLASAPYVAGLAATMLGGAYLAMNKRKKED